MAEGQSLRIPQRLERLHAHPQFAQVKKIISVLQKRGFETWIAGGAVRDGWLGLRPKDLDVATAAPPDVVEAAFKRTLAVGKAFGTIVVIEGEQSFEVTTFRKDGPYVDGRHPEAVEFSEAREDALRRDFTVNALFYDLLKEETIDFVGGLSDLQQRRLRTVGDPRARFSEDYLRMLRAVRLAAQLGFALEADALGAIQTQASAIAQVSAERIFNELRRLLESEFWQTGVELLKVSGLSRSLWPELDKMDLTHFALAPLNWVNAFTLVMFQVEPSKRELRLNAWKAPRDAARTMRAQIDGAKTLMDPSARRAAKARVLGAPEFAESLILAQTFGADTSATVDLFLEVASRKGELPHPLLSGQDLLELGVEPGPRMGQLLKTLYEAQLEGRISDRREALTEFKALQLIF